MKKIIWGLIILATVFLLFWVFVQTKEPVVRDVFMDEEELLKEKIGQMILLGFRGTSASPDSHIKKAITDLKIGGVVLFDYDVPSKSFPRNIVSPELTKKLISDLQMFSEVPLFVVVDAEGGNVNRLKPQYGFLNVSSAEQMGQMSAEAVALEYGALARQLEELGFNMNFAPVVDLNSNLNNPIIGKFGRSFSAEPEKVSEYAEVLIKEHQKQGIIAVAKHFPGHGSSSADSHLGFVDITKTYDEKELEPYFYLQEHGLLFAVMTAHIVNKNIDEKYPATMSEKFLQNILRKEIGFEGVIISDDMQMGAITLNYSFEEALIRAVNAGCDMLLLSNNGQQEYDENMPYRAIDIIYNAVKEGKISEQTIEKAYERIFHLKTLVIL